MKNVFEVGFVAFESSCLSLAACLFELNFGLFCE